MKSSLALNTALPPRTRTGPPPSASTTELQADLRIRRIFTAAPCTASARRRVAAVPRATSTAPPTGIAVPPPSVTPVTGAASSTLGVAAGNGESVISTEPGEPGVAGPQAGVKRETPFEAGGPFTSFSARRGPEPCQVASMATRPTTSAPDESMPMLERPRSGGWSRAPLRITIPLGAPLTPNRSPLTPATVAPAEDRVSIAVRRSVPRIVSRPSTGFSCHRPPGRGTVRTFATTGPFVVNSRLRSYVRPGISSWGAADAGPTRTSASDAMTRRRSTTLDPG